MRFIVSKYLQSLKIDENNYAIWHSIFGRPILISAGLMAILENKTINIADIADGETIEALKEGHILVTSIEDEAKDVNNLYLHHNSEGSNKVKYLSLIMSEECNFRCKYCIHFANSNHQYNKKKFMDIEMATKSIDSYLETIKANGSSEAYINFGGGEPLLNWATIKETLAYVKSIRHLYDFPIKIGINTNLSLLNREIAEILIDNNVEIAASLDGAKVGNDLVRLDKKFNGTYDEIVKGFDILKDLGHPLKGFAMTVVKDNFSEVSENIIDWAASLGMTEVRIDVDVVGLVDIPTGEIAKRLFEVRQHANKKGVSVFGFWSRPAENMGLIPELDDVGFCGGERGNSICVAPSGQVFPCGYSNYELGIYEQIPHIHEGLPYKKLLARRNIGKMSQCDGCPIQGFCRGGCMITNEANKSEKAERMCELYQAMTNLIIFESIENTINERG